MDVSANFAFLKQEFPHAAESATFAAHHVCGDPQPDGAADPFVEMVIDQLTALGVMEASALYEPPFSSSTPAGRTGSSAARTT